MYCAGVSSCSLRSRAPFVNALHHLNVSYTPFQQWVTEAERIMTGSRFLFPSAHFLIPYGIGVIRALLSSPSLTAWRRAGHIYVREEISISSPFTCSVISKNGCVLALEWCIFLILKKYYVNLFTDLDIWMTLQKKKC